ncbi:MAG: transcriptional repressor [Deltaproteobacteria bacterium]|nr:transcriptional repressor [Deltaproteobacteria bacterium]
MNKEVFKTIFEGKRLRMSHPRFFIYQELSTSESPKSPQELYQCLAKKERKIGLTSIYRCLDLFESLGIAFKIVNGSSVKYKLCEMEDHHHHIICKKCGNVAELRFCDLSNWSERVTESTGYEVTDHQLNFYGFCKTCKSLQT